MTPPAFAGGRFSHETGSRLRRKRGAHRASHSHSQTVLIYMQSILVSFRDPPLNAAVLFGRFEVMFALHTTLHFFVFVVVVVLVGTFGRHQSRTGTVVLPADRQTDSTGKKPYSTVRSGAKQIRGRLASIISGNLNQFSFFRFVFLQSQR